VNKYDELSFVESHVDTFYKGLNDLDNCARNPVEANVLNLDEADHVVKCWVKKEKRLRYYCFTCSIDSLTFNLKTFL
jgi:hypothetical protein